MQSTIKLLVTLFLGCWLGASIWFSFVAATGLFHLAKAGVITREQAGDVAEALLDKYFVSALVSLALTTLLAGYLGLGSRMPRYTKCAAITLAALLITAFSFFVWTPRVHQAREERRLHPGPESEKRFRSSHHVSFGMNVLVIAGTAWAFVIATKPE